MTVEVPDDLLVPIARLVRALAPARIVLFGSRAKGVPHGRSDTDLLVIAEAAVDPALVHRARELVATSFPPIDLVLCTPSDAENATAALSPFLLSILDSGITLFEDRQA